MGTLITISQFLLSLAILITLHELGHFMAARFFGIRVEKFYLFFDAWGFKLFKFKKGDTEYGIGWLPLGGYVKIAGMVDESLDTNQMKTEPQPWEFRSKPAWQRLIVMIGGVTVNLILGILIMIIITWNQGDKYIPNSAVNEAGGIYAGPQGRQIGFLSGDKILKINGKPVEELSELYDPDFILKDKNEVLINRNGKDTNLVITANLAEIMGKTADLPAISPPYGFKVQSVLGGSAADKGGLKKDDTITAVNNKPVKVFFEFKEVLSAEKGKQITVTAQNQGKTRELKIAVGNDGTIGFMPDFIGFEGKEKSIEYSLLQSIGIGTSKSFKMLVDNARGLGKVVSGKVDPRKSMAGPVGMAQMYGKTWNWLRFWSLTAMISLVLAFMNILPIPALDGGHTMFLLWEIITRKPVSEKVLYVGQIIGMVVLGSLMLFIFWVDIARALGF